MGGYQGKMKSLDSFAWLLAGSVYVIQVLQLSFLNPFP